MKRTDFTIVWAIILIAAGVLALLQGFDFISAGTGWAVMWAVLFGAAGLSFVWWFLTDMKESWWAVIPGFTLLAIAGLIGLAVFGYTDQGAPWLGALFLGALAASFWVIYAVRRDHWWAIIPAGALTSVALMALAAAWWTGEVLASILFFGLAITFGIVAMIRTPHGHMVWAWIPAGVMAFMGVMILMSFTSAINYLWALAMIGVGIYLLFRQWGRGHMTRQG